MSAKAKKRPRKTARKRTRKPAARQESEKPHAHWEKVVSAAYLRMIGATQKEAAAAVGRSERSIRDWESNEELWTRARVVARSRWLNDAEDAARGAVLKSLRAGNADMGLRLLERLDEDLAPPKVRNEHSGPGGGPIPVRQVEDMSDDELRERAKQLGERLAALTDNGNGKR